MADDRPQFSWWHRQSHEKCQKRGQFTFEDIQPLWQRVAETDSSLLISLPCINLDFTWVSAGEIEMEIHDAEGMHSAVVTLAQAEEAASRALRDWDASILRGRLSDLPIELVVHVPPIRLTRRCSERLPAA